MMRAPAVGALAFKLKVNWIGRSRKETCAKQIATVPRGNRSMGPVREGKDADGLTGDGDHLRRRARSEKGPPPERIQRPDPTVAAPETAECITAMASSAAADRVISANRQTPLRGVT